MKASLIISVYKDFVALDAILRSSELQSEKDFEIIVAQDAEDSCFNSSINAFREKGYTITLIQQKDEGFLKNKILNQAIRVAQSEKLIFIDGDCVLHQDFIKEHVRHLQKGSFCAGKRVNLDAKTSQKIRQGKIIVPTFFEMLLNGSGCIEEAITLIAPLVENRTIFLLGCNMSWHKDDLIMLNGFDEDYTYPGFGEDSDIEFRALLAGLKVINTRGKTIQYHLNHERPEREHLAEMSRALFEQKKKMASIRCKNGLVKD